MRLYGEQEESPVKFYSFQTVYRKKRSLPTKETVSLWEELQEEEPASLQIGVELLKNLGTNKGKEKRLRRMRSRTHFGLVTVK